MSIPAVVLICVIFVDPALFANLVFRQPSGSDEGAGVIMLLCSQKWLRMGPIRSPAALPRTAIRGRAFLSDHPINSRFGLNKDGWSEATPSGGSHLADSAGGFRFAHPTLHRLRGA